MPSAESRVVVDTHALLWWLGDDDRLSARARAAIDGSTAVLTPSIVFWEIGMLSEAGRIELDRPIRQWVHDLVASGEVTDIPVDASSAARSSQLDGFHGDPADRMIVATALTLGVPLVTKDREITDWAMSTALETIWDESP